MEEIIIGKLIKYNGYFYKFIRQIPLHQFTRKDGSIIPEVFNAWKSHLESDHVLKTQTHFIFCETIPDVEWEEVPAMEVENC
jgi:hypothetical protein